MKNLEAIMKSNVSKTGAAFLLISACSSTVGTNPTGDGGKPADGAAADGSTSDGGNTNDGAMGTDAGKDAGPNMSRGSVNLATAGTFVILAKSGISTVPTSAITGALGLSPGAA